MGLFARDYGGKGKGKGSGGDGNMGYAKGKGKAMKGEGKKIWRTQREDLSGDSKSWRYQG